MEVKLKLVEEKSGFLDLFSYPKIFGVFLLLLALPAFFILPFVTNKSWFSIYILFITALFILSWCIMYIKYNWTYDFNKIGTIVLSTEKMIIFRGESNFEFQLNQNKIKFLYNGIRGKGFHFGRDFPRNGIAEIIINEKEQYFAIIKNYEDLESLKKIFNIWYKQKYDFNEFTRTIENHRLIEMEMNFDWNRLTEIKSNATNIN